MEEIFSHFLPKKAHLAKFAESDRQQYVWIYRKQKKGYYPNPDRRPVSRVGGHNRFYQMTLSDNTRGVRTVEQWLNDEIEIPSFPIVGKLLEGSSVTATERVTMARFLSVMARRTPAAKEDTQRQMKDFEDNFLRDYWKSRDDEWFRKEIQARVAHPEQAEQEFLQQLPRFRAIKEQQLRSASISNVLDVDSFFGENIVRSTPLEEYFWRMHWTTLVAPDGVEFVTCDHPLVWGQRMGLLDDRAFFLFPLSKTVVLTGHKSGTGDRRRSVSVCKLEAINKQIVAHAVEEVYASFKSETFTRFVSRWIGTGATWDRR